MTLAKRIIPKKFKRDGRTIRLLENLLTASMSGDENTVRFRISRAAIRKILTHTTPVQVSYFDEYYRLHTSASHTDKSLQIGCQKISGRRFRDIRRWALA
jgi:hypothetical protein